MLPMMNTQVPQDSHQQIDLNSAETHLQRRLTDSSCSSPVPPAGGATSSHLSLAQDRLLDPEP